MTGAFATKLELFTQLSRHERHALDELSRGRVRQVETRQDVIRTGDQPRHAHLLLSGWAYRYKELKDGRRQIIAFLLPGDLCDHNGFVLRAMDHSIATLTPVTLAQLAPESLERLVGDHAGIARALWWEALVNAAIQREWTFNLGQRNAVERIAHLFCELWHRLRSIGLVHGSGFDLPATQQDLAEATGMTVVHVNRTLQTLRARNLIVLDRRRLDILDLAALQDVALYTPNYLHLGGAGEDEAYRSERA